MTRDEARKLFTDQLFGLHKYVARRWPEVSFVTKEFKEGYRSVMLRGLPIFGDRWNRNKIDLLIVIPDTYPYTSPKDFWVSPGNFRMADGWQANGSNDGNMPPPDYKQEDLTWFIWRIQDWDCTKHNLVTYVLSIKTRLENERPRSFAFSDS